MTVFFPCVSTGCVYYRRPLRHAPGQRRKGPCRGVEMRLICCHFYAFLYVCLFVCLFMKGFELACALDRTDSLLFVTYTACGAGFQRYQRCDAANVFVRQVSNLAFVFILQIIINMVVPRYVSHLSILLELSFVVSPSHSSPNV